MPMRRGMKIRATRLPKEERVKVSFWMRSDQKRHLETQYGGVTAGLDFLLRRVKFERLCKETRKPPGRLDLEKVTVVITQAQRDDLAARGGITPWIDAIVAADMERGERREIRKKRGPSKPRKPKALRVASSEPPAPPPDPLRDLAYLASLPLKPCAVDGCGRWPDHWMHHTSNLDRGHTYSAEI